jgi:DNA-binding XRE family transcriptional regulator
MKKQTISRDDLLDRLIKFKNESDYTYEDIAWAMGISSKTIYRWIKRRTKPNHVYTTLIKKYLSNHKISIKSMRQDQEG